MAYLVCAVIHDNDDDDDDDDDDEYADDANADAVADAARRRMTSSKMKRMKQSGRKDQDELEEDNEELFAELGIPPFSCTRGSIKFFLLLPV